MPRQRLIVLAMAVAALIPAFGRTVADLFVEATDRIVPMISTNTRLDMLDYFRAGSDRPSKTIFEGEARITSLSDKVITFTDSKRSSTQMALFTSKNDSILAVITTVATPVEDSLLEFYYVDKEIKNMPKVGNPDYSDWLTQEGRERINEISQVLPFIMTKAEFDEASSTLTFTNNAREQLVTEEYDKISKYLIPTIVYDIDGIKFKLRK